jgi:hypothetical protein
MIVRIMTEGQYELGDDAVETLRHADEELLKAVEAGDGPSFRHHLEQLLVLVRRGRKLGPDDLRASDLVVPPPDMGVAEAQRLLAEHRI